MKGMSALAAGFALVALTGISEAAAPRGFLDGFTTSGAARGWAVDLDTPTAAVTVYFYLDGPRGRGTFIGSARATLRRPDVNSALRIQGDHGFVFQVPARYRDNRAHSLYAYALDTRTRTPFLLSRSPRVELLRGTATPPPRPATPPAPASGRPTGSPAQIAASTPLTPRPATAPAPRPVTRPAGSPGQVPAPFTRPSAEAPRPTTTTPTRPTTTPPRPTPRPESAESGPAAPAAELVYRGNNGGAGVRVLGAALPNGVAATPSAAGPILHGKNVYAPDLVLNGNWNCYYGGWRDQRDTNDRIYFAVSDDLLPEGAWSGQHVIIDHGDYTHVNDPSVQRVGARWTMAYTVARTVNGNFTDWIAISTSSDGGTWTPNRGTVATEVRMNGRNFSDIARPSLVWTGSRWLMYFDGQIDNGPIHSYAAESTNAEPRVFNVVRDYADVGGFPGFFEPDVERLGGRYVAVAQRGFNRLIKLESSNGLDFREVGEIVGVSHPAFGRRFVSNPGLVFDGRSVHGVAYGMNDAPSLTEHDIGFAHLQVGVRVLSSRGVWHGFSTAPSFSEAQALTFGDTQFTRLRIQDPTTGRVLVDRQVTARAGDIWELRRR